MKSLIGVRASILSSGVLLFGITACGPDESSVCGESGSYATDGVAVYCAYAVIAGGFTCPSEVPFRIDGLPSGTSGAVCSDQMVPPSSSRDLPEEVCVTIGAEARCRAAPVSPEVADCQRAADAYLELCEGENTGERLCELERYRELCTDGDAQAIAGTFACLIQNREAGGACGTFTDLTGDGVRACAWEAVGPTSRPSAVSTRDAYCARCESESPEACGPRAGSSPAPFEYVSDALNASLADCFERAADCGAVAACVEITPFAACL